MVARNCSAACADSRTPERSGYRPKYCGKSTSAKGIESSMKLTRMRYDEHGDMRSYFAAAMAISKKSTGGLANALLKSEWRPLPRRSHQIQRIGGCCYCPRRTYESGSQRRGSQTVPRNLENRCTSASTMNVRPKLRLVGRPLVGIVVILLAFLVMANGLSCYWLSASLLLYCRKPFGNRTRECTWWSGQSCSRPNSRLRT